MKTAPLPKEPPAPTLRRIARRLVRFCTSGALDADDLIQEARVALYERREEIMRTPDPIQTCIKLSRRIMWAKIQAANRML
jgi:hypothetical protein